MQIESAPANQGIDTGPRATTAYQTAPSKLKAVVLAGGFGTRLAEQTDIRPKPLVEIGGEPILWHIMKHYDYFGVQQFVVALGYKGDMIKRYFLDQFHLAGNLEISLPQRSVRQEHKEERQWTVHLVETGLQTQTGGRVRRLRSLLGQQTFLLTYGDGVCTVDLNALLSFHREHGRLATITAVHPPARFGGLDLAGPLVTCFTEKSQIREGWINGGFMVLEPGIFEYLHDDEDSLEADLLTRLAEDGELAAFRHDGFWHCMDTMRDLRDLESLWQSGHAPWKTW